MAFTASHKTLAFGMPLFTSIFQGPQLALMSASLLITHPMQSVVGGALVSRLEAYATEYPSYASHVPGLNKDPNDSSYSDRTWAIIRRGVGRSNT